MCLCRGPNIEDSIPWAFFNGTKVQKNNKCREGLVVYFSYEHFIEISLGFGLGTNHQAELVAF